jgi:DNA-binding protein YbaB
MTGPDYDAGAQESFSDAVAGVRRTVERLGELRTRAETVSVTESSADGGITVTVNSGGVLTGLRITDQVTEVAGAQIAEQVLATMRRAQARIAGRMDEVLGEAAADDPELRQRVLAVYHDRFPEPDPEPTPDEEIPFDLPADDAAPPVRHAARRPRPADRDDDYWDDRDGGSILQSD